MSASMIVVLMAVGMAAGILSSMVGIGGGTLIVPALVLIFAMSQKTAQGTSLAMLVPPIGILAAINYYRAGYVDLKVAAILCVTFVVGGFIGSKIAINMQETTLKKLFGVFLMILAVKYLFFDK